MTQESLDKKKGVPDIVFLLDATGSMASCIDAVTRNISIFIDTLNTPDSNGGILIRDWRIKVVGYRDRDCDGAQWLVDNPFSTDAGEVKSQLAALKAAGGGDEPESLLDAMYQVAQWNSAEKGASPTSDSWRHRHDAARVVVIFTDASSKNTFTASGGSGGTVDDLIQAYHAAKLKVILFAPDAPVYADLSAMNGLEWEPVGALGSDPQQALVDFTTDTNNFRKVMEALAKSVSASAAVPPAL
jgi:hypothetical protein